MRIGRTEFFFEKVDDMVCLEEVFNEVKNNTTFLYESKDMLDTLVNVYHLKINFESIQKQKKYFLDNIKPVSNEDLKSIKKELRDELMQLKNKQIGDGDLDILAYCRKCKKESSTVITHDEELFFLLSGEAKTLFLVEFIIENIHNLEDVSIEEVNYLYYYCLKRYASKSLNEIREKLGKIGDNFYLKNLRIRKFITDRDLYQHRVTQAKFI